MLQHNTQVVYAEARTKEQTLRFIFPQSLGIVNKFQTFGAKHDLPITRIGTATIQAEVPELSSEGDVTNLAGIVLEDCTYYRVTFHDHPDLHQGTGRYSQELVDLVENSEAVIHEMSTASNIEVSAAPAAPVAPTKSLADSIRAQMSIPKIEVSTEPSVHIAPAQVEATPASLPSVENQVSTQESPSNVRTAPKIQKPAPIRQKELTQSLLEQAKRSQKPTTSLPTSNDVRTRHSVDDLADMLETLTDVVFEIQDVLHLYDQSATGRDLAAWFSDYSKECGWDQTFNVLAAALKSVPEGMKIPQESGQ